MIQHMTYFRFKKLTLGKAYERFLEQCLEPGGTIFIVDCRLKWPTTQYGDRHIFQFGALGGATPDEYHRGGERVEAYLTRYKSHRKRWEPPAADGERPEAEWGCEPRLADDIERFATERGYFIRHVTFGEPEHASPLVADFYQWWNEKRGITGQTAAGRVVHRHGTLLDRSNGLYAVLDCLQHASIRCSARRVSESVGAPRRDLHDAVLARRGLDRPRVDPKMARAAEPRNKTGALGGRR